MVIKEDGTKWACQSCLKGHRVSGCTHKDRELTLVPKKGRPVTQCAHCRHERKKRSAHVRCDCGETDKPHHSKEKCIHLREAEERTKAGLLGHHFEEKDSAHLFAVAEEQGCCCHHGGNCTCAVLRKDFENGGAITPPLALEGKSRLATTVSDGSITVFHNGHHKPVHRKNHMAHECGMPYKMPVQRTSAEHSVAKAARRSVDSLALDNNLVFDPSPFASRDMTRVEPTRRLSKSEHPSPSIHPRSALEGAELTDLDLDNLGPSITTHSFQSESYDFSSADPMSGVVRSSYDPWLPDNDFTCMPNNNPFGVWPTNDHHHALAQPALTAASSGTQSEIDEYPPMDDVYGFGMPSVQEAADDAVFDTFAQGSPQSNRRSLPADFFSSATYAMPNAAGDWLASGENFSTGDSKPKLYGDAKNLEVDAPWQYSPVVGSPQRPVAGLPSARRPTSQSVGAAAAPTDDLMQQLFPGIDVTGTSFPLSPNFDGKTQIMPSTSSAEFATLDDTSAFASQSWTNGSLSIPNDHFSSPYDMDGDFSSTDFASWPQ